MSNNTLLWAGWSVAANGLSELHCVEAARPQQRPPAEVEKGFLLSTLLESKEQEPLQYDTCLHSVHYDT